MAISDTPFDAHPLGLILPERTALDRAPRTPPERQWWNLPGKFGRAQAIGEEGAARARRVSRAQGLPNSHNNAYDAVRHARWSQRMANEIGPVTATVAGYAHELRGMLHGQPGAEARMDPRNNAEGRRAADERRAIRPENLQVRLDVPSASNGAYPRARPRGGGPGSR